MRNPMFACLTAACLVACGAADRPSVEGECDVVAGTGCGPGEGCFKRPRKPAHCAPEGSVGRGGTCSRPSDCRSGWHCVRSRTSGICMKACRDEDSSVCVTGSTCVPLGTDGTGACSIPCDPVAQKGCGPDVACLLLRSGPTCWTWPGTGTQGAACENMLSCEPGFTCMRRPTGSFCLQICEPDEPECADSGTTCEPIGASAYGACRERWNPR